MASQGKPSSDPMRRQLKDVRRSLLRLHRALLQVERAQLERQRGPLSNVELLQALLQDPVLAWLRPFSGLVSDIDAALADSEPLPDAQARAFLEQARRLVDESADTEGSARYQELVKHDPDVLLAHVELTHHLALPETGTE